MGQIHWIGIDGTKNVEQAKEPPRLEQMQDFIGGYIEHAHVYLDGGILAHMYFNEDGWLLNLKPNPTASEIFLANRAAPPGSFGIVGAAIVLEGFN